MSETAIRVENLGKEYRIGIKRRKSPSLRDTISDWASEMFGGKSDGSDPGTFWALKDLNFEVKRGDVVGLVGHNGAGKSTLLKLLSRITEPTTGFAEIHGRIGSLLEVGTGFHPELSGRENILLNGAILGMRRTEIERHFDEIVEFAGVEKFIDTPVKRFSSGMYLRLAFAVAVHLESEILLVDEVLAVGDAQFQKKCLDKMKAVNQSGRTVFLVSHNMSAIRNICTRGLILEAGRMLEYGEVNAVTDKYLARLQENPGTAGTVETHYFKVHEVHIESTRGPVIKTFDPVHVRIKFTPKIDIRNPSAIIGILSGEHQRLLGLDFRDFEAPPPLKAGETIEMTFQLQELPLLPGSYYVELYLRDAAQKVREHIPRNFGFEVVSSPVYGGRQLEASHGLVGLRVTTAHTLTATPAAAISSAPSTHTVTSPSP